MTATTRTSFDRTSRTDGARAPRGSAPQGNGALHRMNRDWDVLAHDQHAADRVDGWARQDPAIAGARTPQDVVDRLAHLGRLGDWAGHDRLLTAVLRRAKADDVDGQLAWLVAVRVMMPKAIRMTGSQIRPGLDWDTVFSTMLSSLCEMVRTYPLERRPRAVFANLAMDTLMLARRALAADFDDHHELKRIAASLTPVAGHPGTALLPGGAADPSLRVELAELLSRAAELELVGRDEPELSEGDARADLLALVMWAVEVRALTVDDAQRITAYYCPPVTALPDRSFRTTRAMGAEGARLRQRASRATRPLREADLNAFLASA